MAAAWVAWAAWTTESDEPGTHQSQLNFEALCYPAERLFNVSLIKIETLQRQWTHFRAGLSYFLIAAAQFLSPAAAADPASKIDPPAWSYQHSQEEIQAYGARITAQEPDEKLSQRLRESRLRRILAQQPIGKR